MRTNKIEMRSVPIKMISCKVLLLFACAALAKGQRIFGGTEAAVGEFPWQVSLQYTRNTYPCSIPFCSGIILDEFHILTAASCTNGADTYTIQVVSRTLDISATENGVGNGTRSRVAKLTMHWLYDPSTLSNNIAIWRLLPTEGIELDGVHAAAIKLLPQDTPVVAGTPTQVAGWGLTRPGGSTSGVLLKADVPVIDYNECQTLYNGGLLSDEICAGTAENEMDSCEGDTGGALVYNGTLIGVATWGNTCGGSGSPGIYTNAASFTDWITDNSGVKAN